MTSRPRLESSDDRLGHGCGHSGAALDADPRRAPPLMRAHNCGADYWSQLEHHNEHIFPTLNLQPAQSASLARMRDSRLSTPLELSDVLAVATYTMGTYSLVIA